jgi:DNA-directed RNA polymerase subunit alpha
MGKIKVAPHTPTEVDIKEIGKNRAEITAWPFETGYAITLAHPLRRLMLGSSIGYAPISLKIDGVLHEFDSVRGMKEDIAVFIINLKNIKFKIKGELERAVVTYNFKGPKEVLASDLENDQVEILNGKELLATLNDDAELNFTIEIAKGIGYVPSEDLRDSVDSEAIALDAFFTPVKKANYKIENVLVEDSPNFEKIIFEIETDGRISPRDAFANALETMNKQMQIFSGVFDIDLEATRTKGKNESLLKSLLLPVDMLGFSTRSYNSVEKAGIKYLGELVLMSENEIKSIKNLGKKSFDEIMTVLEENGFGPDYQMDSKVRADLVEKIKYSGFCTPLELVDMYNQYSQLLVISNTECLCMPIREALLCGCTPVVYDPDRVYTSKISDYIQYYNEPLKELKPFPYRFEDMVLQFLFYLRAITGRKLTLKKDNQTNITYLHPQQDRELYTYNIFNEDLLWKTIENNG